VKNIDEVSQDRLGAVQVNRALVILGEDHAHAGIDLLKVCVGHEPGWSVTRNLHGVGLRLRANRLILGAVVHEWVFGARAHLADKLDDQGAREALREGELQLISRVDHAINNDPILAEAVARGKCGEGFALHDKITV
jgi:hypothetical protein